MSVVTAYLTLLGLINEIVSAHYFLSATANCSRSYKTLLKCLPERPLVSVCVRRMTPHPPVAFEFFMQGLWLSGPCHGRTLSPFESWQVQRLSATRRDAGSWHRLKKVIYQEKLILMLKAAVGWGNGETNKNK